MAVDPSQAPELTAAADSEAKNNPVAKVNAVMAHVNYGLAATQRGVEKRGGEQEKEGDELATRSRINKSTKEGHAAEENENIFMKSQKEIAEGDKGEKSVPEPTSTRQPRPSKLF